MASRIRGSEPPPPRRPPGKTPDARENQMIALAVDLTEKQLREGTASATTIVHYLKLGSSRERLEQEKIKHENALSEAKREAMESMKRVEDMYVNALNAMRSYSGQEPLPPPEAYDD